MTARDNANEQNLDLFGQKNWSPVDECFLKKLQLISFVNLS